VSISKSLFQPYLQQKSYINNFYHFHWIFLKMGQSQRRVEEGGIESGGVGSFKKLTAPSCTEPGLQQRIRHGRRSWGVVFVRMI